MYNFTTIKITTVHFIRCINKTIELLWKCAVIGLRMMEKVDDHLMSQNADGCS